MPDVKMSFRTGPATVSVKMSLRTKPCLAGRRIVVPSGAVPRCAQYCYSERRRAMPSGAEPSYAEREYAICVLKEAGE